MLSRLLLKFWFSLILGLSFAAGSGIDLGIGDNGGGGGDGGADQSGGDDADGGGDSGASDQDDQGDLSGEAGADGGDSTGGDGGDADPNAPVDLGDGRQVPGKFKKLFDLAKQAGLEKEAKQLYFAQQRLNKAIPGGINGAIQLMRTVDELGGVEGIEDLRSQLDIYQADALDFENNPSKWIESSFKESADASLKAWAHSLDFVAEHHPEQYDHYMAKVIVNDLANLDVRAIFQKLSAIKDDPEAKQLAAALAAYYNDRVKTSKNAPEKKADARSKELESKTKELETREMGIRQSQARTEIKLTLNNQIGSAIRAEAKARGLDMKKLAEEYRGEYIDLVSKIHAQLNKRAMKDNLFLRNYHAHLVKGDVAKAVALCNQKHDSIVREVAREMFEGSGVFRGKKRAGADKGDKGDKGNQNGNAGAQNQGWTQVQKRPENSLIDWRKTTTSLQMDGKYILKDGKKVVVKY